MKIIPSVSTGSLRISGPLSRNDRIMRLSPGDTVDVRILERTGKETAVIDLLGNRVHARFTGGVPRDDRLSLVMSDMKNGILEFSLHSTESNKAGLNFIAHLFLREKELSPEKTRAFIAAMKGRIPGAFSLAMILSGTPVSGNHNDIRGMLDVLRKRGFHGDRLFAAGAMLSGLSDRDTVHLMKLFGSTGFFSAEKMSENTPEGVYIADAESAVTSSADFLIQWDDEGGNYEAECVKTPEFYAGRIETPRLGLIEFVVRKGSDLSVTVVCDDSIRDIVISRFDELVSSLESHYGKATAVCMARSEWDEKVLAFAEKTGKRALDVTV